MVNIPRGRNDKLCKCSQIIPVSFMDSLTPSWTSWGPSIKPCPPNMNIPVSVDTLVLVDLFWNIMLIDCPRSGSNALALTGSVAKAVLISMEWSIKPISSLFVNWEIHMKFFPESDVEDVDIKRVEFRQVISVVFLIVELIAIFFPKLPRNFFNCQMLSTYSETTFLTMFFRATTLNAVLRSFKYCMQHAACMQHSKKLFP